MRSDTAVRQLFLSSSGLDSYSVSFPVYAASELLVKVQSGSEPERTLALGTDYSVSNLSPLGGAKVNLLRSVGAGSTVCVMSKLPYAQELSLGSATAIRPATLETQLDRTAQQIQQIAQSLERKVGIADTTSGTAPSAGWFEEQVSAASGYAGMASGYASSAAATVSGFDAYASGQGALIVSSAREAVSGYVSEASGYASTASGAAALVSTMWAGMQQGTVTASSAITSGSQISLPSGMSYVVGKQHLMVAVGGMLADPSAVTETGTSGLASTGFQLNFDVASGQKIHVSVGTLGALPAMSGQSGKVLTNDGSLPAWADMGGMPDPTGQSGKSLMSDGDRAVWGMVDVSGAIASHNLNASAHVDIRTALSGKADSAYVSSYVSGEVSGLVGSAAMSSYVSGAISGLTDSAYVSSAVSGLTSSSYVLSAVSAHDASSAAHSDIRTAVSGILPAQSGQSGKVLGTDGTSALWTTVSGSELPSQSGQSGKFLSTNGTAASWAPVSTMATVTDTASTMIALPTAAANTNYSYGELVSLALGFSASGTANAAVHIMFKSGATATTLTVDGTNALFGSFTPNTNAVVEIDARFYAPLSKWVVLFSQVATS